MRNLERSRFARNDASRYLDQALLHLTALDGRETPDAVFSTWRVDAYVARAGAARLRREGEAARSAAQLGIGRKELFPAGHVPDLHGVLVHSREESERREARGSRD